MGLPLSAGWQGIESGSVEVDGVPRVEVGEISDKVERSVEDNDLVESGGEGVAKSASLITGTTYIEMATKAMHIAAP